MIRNIGIVGRGFVGSAVAFGFGHGCGADYNIYIFDKDPKKSENSLLLQLIYNNEWLFLNLSSVGVVSLMWDSYNLCLGK